MTGHSQDWCDAETAREWSADSFGANAIRREHLDILLALLADLYQPGKHILDLGFGSGIVEALIFEALPYARVVGVDISAEMMALAAQRLVPFADRYEAVSHDLADVGTLVLPPHAYQFVISVQALHHLAIDALRAAYQFAHHTLEPGGYFVLADRVQVEGLWDIYRSMWQRQDRVYGTRAAQAEGDTPDAHEHLLRARGDLPVPLDAHLRLLESIGFEAKCLHLHANRALIVARRPA